MSITGFRRRERLRKEREEQARLLKEQEEAKVQKKPSTKTKEK